MLQTYFFPKIWQSFFFFRSDFGQAFRHRSCHKKDSNSDLWSWLTKETCFSRVHICGVENSNLKENFTVRPNRHIKFQSMLNQVFDFSTLNLPHILIPSGNFSFGWPQSNERCFVRLEIENKKSGEVRNSQRPTKFILGCLIYTNTEAKLL
jgi:hypothetical protein